MNKDEIDNIFNKQKKNSKLEALFTYEKRVELLLKLKEVIILNEEKIFGALKKDLNKAETESFLTEIQFVYSEIDHTLAHLKSWMKPTRVKTPLLIFPATSFIYHEKKGVVLVIAPWNYPFQLALSPVVAAIAAGNTVIIKPSELAPKTSEILFDIISKHFDLNTMAVINGGVEETKFLLEKPFDHIFYTGNGVVAKSILKQAAEHLTPVTLELGGKSPCLVFTKNNLELAAKRIIWGKFLNAGQTCVAPDYILIDPVLKNEFIKYCQIFIKSFYGDSANQSPDYGRIINLRHFKRLTSLYSSEEIIFGGQSNEEDLYIEPTLLNASLESKIMSEEIFGPILPIIEIEKLENAISYINSHDKPLAIYLFSDNNDEIELINLKVSAGGVCINDTIMHLSSPYLPFGGIGASGQGAYHGKFGFDIFSHHKAVLKRSYFFDMFIKYPPYLNKLKFFRYIFKFLSLFFFIFFLGFNSYAYEWNQLVEIGVVNKIATPKDEKTTEFKDVDIKKKLLTPEEVTQKFPKVIPPRNIVIIGDTGCRLAVGKVGPVYQNCASDKDWPFYKITESSEKENPDLIIHLGDYHYREKCIAGKICEKMSPAVGYGWIPWELDFFLPMKNLLLKSPIMIVRGNHEDCERAHVGYKKLLSNVEWDKECLDFEPTQIILFDDLAIINFDSSDVSEMPFFGDDSVWIKRFNEINAKLDKLKIKKAWIFTHKPMYGIMPFKMAMIPGNLNLRSYFEKSLLKEKVTHIFSGHIHTSLIVTPVNSKVKQIVVGNSGTQLHKFEAPITKNILQSFSYESAELISSGFGYAVLKKTNEKWEIIFKDQNAIEIAKKDI